MRLTRANYHGKKANVEYMSVSQFKSFKKCEARALAEIKGEYVREESTALLVGSYVDAYFDGTMDKFTKAHPEMFKKDGSLKADFAKANEIIARIEKDAQFMRYLKGKKQCIMTGTIKDVPVKIMMDVYLPGKRIVDRKIMADFDRKYDESLGWIPFYEAWGYDTQGGVYQEIVRQNIGEKLPFYLGAATKEKIPDIDLIYMEQSTLDIALEDFENNVERYDAIKKGIIPPERCNKCDYCKSTKVLTEPTSSDEYI